MMLAREGPSAEEVKSGPAAMVQADFRVFSA